MNGNLDFFYLIEEVLENSEELTKYEYKIKDYYLKTIEQKTNFSNFESDSKILKEKNKTEIINAVKHLIMVLFFLNLNITIFTSVFINPEWIVYYIPFLSVNLIFALFSFSISIKQNKLLFSNILEKLSENSINENIIETTVNLIEKIKEIGNKKKGEKLISFLIEENYQYEIGSKESIFYKLKYDLANNIYQKINKKEKLNENKLEVKKLKNIDKKSKEKKLEFLINKLNKNIKI